ncbi:MAG: glycosyl hydrolase, partial [Thermoguttaceae bacterium]|nr:glycosyl hydrolase [Thermoguttaceae bacterium]
ATSKQSRACCKVARVPEREFPDYCLAAVSLKLDTDGDGLSDDEEPATGTDPARPDSDSDGMPDGWEKAHGLDPLRDDAGADADRDGFSNHQEYWAATDPRSGASFPGKPSNPNMNSTARAVLRYLALLPSRTERRVVVGQHVTNIDAEYETQVVELHRRTGKWPGLLSVQYEGQTKPLQIAEANACALAYWKQGGLVKIKWRPHDPWTGRPNYQRPTRNQPDWVDIPGLLDPEHSANPQNREANRRACEVYMGWLEAVAQGLKALRDAGVVVLWRPCSEMNGGWFWWGRRSQQDYLALWRHQYQYLTVQHKLDNLLWVYESASGVHDMVPADYYYPGDEYVDVMGHNLYDKTWDLPFEANDLFRGYPKVYAFPQAGTEHGLGKPTDGSWSNLTYIEQIRARYPRCSFFAAWNSFVTGGGRIPVRLAIVDNPHARELMEDPWIVTRDRLDWRGSDH